MGFPNVSVNSLSVLIAAVASFIIGWIWYGPLFGKLWAKEMGFGKKEMEKAKQKGMGKLLLMNFIGTLITAYVLAILVTLLSFTTFKEGAMLGFWVWLGFFASTTLLGGVLWENKSWNLYLIGASYWILNLIVMAGILSVWK